MKLSKAASIAILPIIAASVLLGILSGFTDKIDDAYISLTIAKTFAESGTWGMLPGVFADSATSPVPVLLLSGVYLIPGVSSTLAVGLWTTLATAVGLSSAFMFKPLTSKFWWHLTVGVLVFLTPISISSFGLETVGVTAALLWLVPSFLYDKKHITGVSLVALCILRPEAIIFAGPLLIYFTLQKNYRLAINITLGIGIFYLVRWVLLGSIIPDTLLMKIGQSGTWGSANYINGLWKLGYSNPSLWVLSGLLVVSFLSALALGCKTRNYKILVLLGSVLLYAFTFLLTGTPPYHWYYAVPVAVLILLADFVSPWVTSTGLLLLLIATAVLGPVTTNWGTDKQYSDLGTQLSSIVGQSRVTMENAEIGNIAYHCSCDIRDPFTDPSDHYDRVNKMAGLKGYLFKGNYLFRDLTVDKGKSEFVLTTKEKPGQDLVKTWDVNTNWSAKTYFLYKSR